MTNDLIDGTAEFLEQRIAILRRRLRVLQFQRDQFGEIAVPAYIVLECQDTERKLSSLNAELRRIRPEVASVRNPYVGLFTFQETDVDWFFGREALTAELVEHIRQSPFLALLGPS